MDRLDSLLTLNNYLEPMKLYSRLLTNSYASEQDLNLLIERGVLFFDVHDEIVFLYQKKEDFFYIFYFAVSIDTLQKGLKWLNESYSKTIFILDIVGNNASIESLSSVIENVGFREYSLLQRMTKIVKNEPPNIHDDAVTFAQKHHSMIIFELLHTSFDKYKERLPCIEEIDLLITKNQILIIEEHNNVLGFLIFDVYGKTTILRYWFVSERARDKKVGSRLLSRYVELVNLCNRFLLWVVTDNANAVKRYMHNSYVFEDLYNKVFIINK